MTAERFQPAWWLPGPHAQTLWARLVRSPKILPMRREILETPDHDDLVIDHLVTSREAGAPLVVLLHGLEGSSYSVHVRGLLAQIAIRGWRAAAMNFRSCACDPQDPSRLLPNRRPRLYHSGETGDFDFVVRTLAGREPGVRLVAIGVSLGGNVLLKWLGEHPAQDQITAAVTISVPYDLAAGSRCMESGIGRVYVRWFLKTLCGKAIDVARRFPDAAQRIDVARLKRARTFREFDDAATAPLHGFHDADDYYARSSSIHFASRIGVPALCLSAEDDPFLPREVLPRFRAAASPAVDLVVTRAGGHAGFLAGMPWKYHSWAEESAVEWLARQVSGVRC